MTDLSNKMTSVAKGGYRADTVRHILKGQKDRVARLATFADILDVMQDFDADTLTELYEHVQFLRRRDTLFAESSTDGQAGASGETPANSTGITGDCARCGVKNVRLYHLVCQSEGTGDVCEQCYWGKQ